MLRLRSLEVAGSLTPDAVLADAADPDSPLHPHFTWDDSEAAQQYRIQQARDLIVRFRVDVRTTERTVRAVVYMRDPRARPNEQGMVSLERLMTDADLAREVVVQEVSRALDLLRRAHVQADALGLGHLVAALVDNARQVRDSIASVRGV